MANIKHKPIAKIENLPIYDRVMCYTNSLPEAIKALEKRFGVGNLDLMFIEGFESAKGLAAPVPCNNVDGVIKAWVMYSQDGEGIGTISHEANHIKNFIFDYIGQELDSENDEAESYLVGYLSDRFDILVRNNTK